MAWSEAKDSKRTKHNDTTKVEKKQDGGRGYVEQ
jgi:hypothetical protein